MAGRLDLAKRPFASLPCPQLSAVPPRPGEQEWSPPYRGTQTRGAPGLGRRLVGASLLSQVDSEASPMWQLVSEADFPLSLLQSGKLLSPLQARLRC